MRALPAIALLLGACAQAGDEAGELPDAERLGGGGPDGRPGTGNPTDAQPFNAADAPETFEPLPDARPPAPPPDAAPGCTPAWTNLLANANLDGGATGWGTYSVGGVEVITDGAPLTPHTPPRVAWLAGYNDGHEQIWQTVTVPATTTQLRFRGYGCFVTTETLTGAYDASSVSLHDAGAASLLEVLVLVTNDDAGSICDFVAVEAVAAEPYAGRRIDLLLEGRNDPSYPTSFWWDTLALEAYACP